MKTGDNLVRVFTGSEITVNLLKDELENAGISVIIQNDLNSSVSAGFATGTPYSIDLFIREFDLQKAGLIIREFVKINK